MLNQITSDLGIPNDSKRWENALAIDEGDPQHVRRDSTLAEIAAHMEDSHGLRVAQSTIWRLLDRHGLTFKKNRTRQ